MLDAYLANRWHLEKNEHFLSPEVLQSLLRLDGSGLSRASVDVCLVCSADFLNEVVVVDDQAIVVLDSMTLETAFEFWSCFRRYRDHEVYPKLIRQLILKTAVAMSLAYSDAVQTAGFLAEYLAERIDVEVVLTPDTYVLDERDSLDQTAKRCLAAHIIGHEVSHYLLRIDPDYRSYWEAKVAHLAKHARSVVRRTDPNSTGARFVDSVIAALSNSSQTSAKSIGDVEELICDFAAGEAVMRSVNSSTDGDPEHLQTAFSAVQGAISINWAVAAIRHALDLVILSSTVGTSARDELLMGRSLMSATNLAAYQLTNIDGHGEFDAEAATRVIQMTPDPDETLVPSFNDLWTYPEQFRRTLLGAVYVQKGLVDPSSLADSIEQILRS